MTSLHHHLKKQEAWDRAYEQAKEELLDELGREPTQSELEDRACDIYANPPTQEWVPPEER